ncbi:MAG: phage tail protein [Burkholderiales bacterium]
MNTSAPFLPAVARPPHDPRTVTLNAAHGWRPLADSLLPAGVAVDAASGGLALAPLPGSGRLLGEASGGFGGLAWPDHVVGLPDGGLVLLDRVGHRLLRFDPCCCEFNPWPCLADGDPRLPATFASIAFACGQLLLPDPGAQRIVVLNAANGALRGAWSAPIPAGGARWTPYDAAATTEGGIVVTDPANGGLHFLSAHGAYRGFVGGLGAVRSLAVDCFDFAYVRRDGEDAVLVVDLAQRRVVGSALRPAEIGARFAPLPVTVLANGWVDVGAYCEPPAADPVFVDAAGAIAGPPAADALPLFPPDGTWISGPLDSEIAACVFDRVELAGCAPAHTRVEIATVTADALLTDDQLAEPWRWAPAGAWRDAAAADDHPPARLSQDFMLRSGPGRYCWLRLRFIGTAHASPCIDLATVDFPRVSLRRYLPVVFGAEPVAAEFTDRWLAIFDRGLRGIEAQVDEQARLFDPLSAPAAPDVPASRDFLAFLARWVGVALVRSWPLARQRRFLKHAPRVYPWRGTVAGLRASVYLFLGLDRWVDCVPAPACCVPCPTRARDTGALRWRPPRVVLEHFRLRRWLALDHARLSDAAKLWGQRIVNRSQLSGRTDILRGGASDGAQLGVTQLTMTQDPARDPFHVYAHRMSLFVPAACARDPAVARALARLVEDERPAHVAVQTIFVEPRFRVGVQSMLGLDAVIGVRARPVALDGAPLGRGTVLTGGPGGGDAAAAPHHVGATRVGMNTIVH